MFGVITRKADNGVTAPGSHMVGNMGNLVCNCMDQSVGKTQVTMVGEHHRLVHQPAKPGDVGCIQLRHVQVDHIRLADQFPGPKQHTRHEQAFTDTHQRWYSYNGHAVHFFQTRQTAIKLRREYGHLMTAPGKGARQPFSIDGQA